MLTPAQLRERANNKIAAKLFFAVKDLQKNALEIDGVISTKMPIDSLLESKICIEREIEVLEFIQSAIRVFKPKSNDEFVGQVDLDDLINTMISNNK